jgi:transposase
MEKIREFLPGRKEHVGRTAADNRLFVNGVLWVLRSGARWADLPERYGKYKSVHKRFVRWANSGVWERVFHELVRDKKNQYLMLDSTIVRAPAGGHGPQKRGADKALGRSRGGLTTRIHLLTNELGLPLDFLITGGQVNDCAQAIELLGQHKAEAVLADKGYDADAIVEHVEAMGAKAVIPPKRHRKVQCECDKNLYKQRNRIERCFSKPKCFRRFAARYEKSKACFKALVALACACLHLRLYVDTA